MFGDESGVVYKVWNKIGGKFRVYYDMNGLVNACVTVNLDNQGEDRKQHKTHVYTYIL